MSAFTYPSSVATASTKSETSCLATSETSTVGGGGGPGLAVLSPQDARAPTIRRATTADFGNRGSDMTDGIEMGVTIVAGMRQCNCGCKLSAGRSTSPSVQRRSKQLGERLVVPLRCHRVVRRRVGGREAVAGAEVRLDL